MSLIGLGSGVSYCQVQLNAIHHLLVLPIDCLHYLTPLLGSNLLDDPLIPFYYTIPLPWEMYEE